MCAYYKNIFFSCFYYIKKYNKIKYVNDATDGGDKFTLLKFLLFFFYWNLVVTATRI